MPPLPTTRPPPPTTSAITSTNSNTKPNQYTCRIATLRLESPFLKHDAVYFIKCSRRDFSCMTQFSATANFGVAHYRNSVRPPIPFAAVVSPTSPTTNGKRTNKGHERTFSVAPNHFNQQQVEISSTNFARLQTQPLQQNPPLSSGQLGFPARESAYWERPACLLNFNPNGGKIEISDHSMMAPRAATNVPVSPQHTDIVHHDCSPSSSSSSRPQQHQRDFPSISFAIPTFAEKILKIEILESLVPNQATSLSSTLFRVGSAEVDLAKVFADKSARRILLPTESVVACSSDISKATATATTASSSSCCYVPEFRIPFRFGSSAMTDVGADLFLSFRFDLGDDRSKTPHVVPIGDRSVPSGSNAIHNDDRKENEKQEAKASNTSGGRSSTRNFHHADHFLDDENHRNNNNDNNDDDDNDDDDDDGHDFFELQSRRQKAAEEAEATRMKKKQVEKEATKKQKLAQATRRGNTGGKALSTVLPPITSSISAVGVLQDLLNMLSDERQEEPLLIKQINELTNRKKALVVNNFFGMSTNAAGGGQFGGAEYSPLTSSVSGGGVSGSASCAFANQTSTLKKIEEIQERLTSATTELLRTVCCDRIVMMYRSALTMALEKAANRGPVSSSDAVSSSPSSPPHKAKESATEKYQDDPQESNVESTVEQPPPSSLSSTSNAPAIPEKDSEQQMLLEAQRETKRLSVEMQNSILWDQAIELMERKWKVCEE